MKGLPSIGPKRPFAGAHIPGAGLLAANTHPAVLGGEIPAPTRKFSNAHMLTGDGYEARGASLGGSSETTLGSGLKYGSPAKSPKGPKAAAKIEKTMHEFKHGQLHSGSKQGPKVTGRKQAVAIALNQARKAGK